MEEPTTEEATQGEPTVETTASGTTTWAKKPFEAWGLFMDMNLTISRQLTDFAANAAKEGVSLGAELHTANLEALQEGQAYVMKCLSTRPQDMKQPNEMYRKAMHELTESSEHVTKLVQGNAQAIMRSSEHYWLMAQQTGNAMKDTYAQWYEKVTGLYPPA